MAAQGQRGVTQAIVCWLEWVLGGTTTNFDVVALRKMELDEIPYGRQDITDRQIIVLLTVEAVKALFLAV